MPTEDRPDPDQLLAGIQASEAKSRRGKLKIFLGMCPGVGKTYSMLRAGRARLEGGVKMLVGVVEHHGRAETLALLDGVPVLPRKQIDYRGVTVEEMDLDALLASHPALTLVDELAHTNAPGSRHPKRYQDVMEILDAGIDVYTTLNVQHVESRVDLVRQITGAPVHETVPDSILDQADEVELIDLTPDQLLKRLADGKVYLGDRAEAAIKSFFREGNLTALREMALRYTAERVDRQLRGMMQSRQITGPWHAGERLLVAVGPSPFSERLIRWTRRTAAASDASWIAVYVDPARVLSEEQKIRVSKNLELARQLGAEVVMTTGEDIVETLLRVARQNNVSQIVVGKSLDHPLFEWLRGGSLVTRLIRAGDEIDIYVVRNEMVERPGKPAFRMPVLQSPNRDYGLALAVVAALTLACWFIAPLTGKGTISLIYLLAVVISALRFGRGPVFLIATLSALLWNFLFIPPTFTFQITALEDALMFGMYFVVALVFGTVTTRLRNREMAERRRETRATALNDLLRSLAAAPSLEIALAGAAKKIDVLLNAEATVLLPAEEGGFAPYPLSLSALDDREEAVAAWAFKSGKPAGRFTDTLPNAAHIYLPMKAGGHTVGVLSVRLAPEKSLSLDEKELLQTFAAQIAVAVEQDNVGNVIQRAKLMEESERLRKTLLDSVSHELKTPLAAISSAAQMLARPDVSPQNRQTGILEIAEGADRLTQVVNNLLDMTRIESGLLQPKLEWCEVTELFQSSIEKTRDRLSGHTVGTMVANGMPLVRLDFSLVQQCLTNLLANAANHTPPGSTVRMLANLEGSRLLLRVEDDGQGLETPDQVFEKFYRGPGAAPGGLGLGMSIVRGLIEAHGGTITAENRPEGGARFSISLPVETMEKLPDQP